MRTSARTYTYAAIGTIALLVALLVWVRGPGGILGGAEVIFRGWSGFWVPLIPALVLGVVALRVDAKNREWGPYILGAAILFVIGLCYSFFVHSYFVAKEYSSDTVKVSETPSYAERGPWNVAQNYASREQGKIVGDREEVNRVFGAGDATAGQGSRYTSVVRKRAFLGMAGYEAVQTMTMPMKGAIPASATTHCSVPEGMDKRGGSFWPWHSLTWSITSQKPLAHWDDADLYGYCDPEGNPVFVQPLWKYEGFFITTKAPDGAAVYTKGEVRILDAAALADQKIEGPTYPMSLASKQRESLRGMGTLFQYYGNTTGYDLTGKDSEDVNLDNATEFVLVSAVGEPQFVTPLTPRGSSESITALSVVPATQQPGKGRVPVTINSGVDLPATSTLAMAIKESSVSGDNSWTSRWASGMKIYEVLPGKDGHWVASVGQGQAVSYRADIAPDGKVTVTNVETGASTTKEPTGSTSGKPLSEMSKEELLRLIQDAAKELEKRG